MKSNTSIYLITMAFLLSSFSVKQASIAELLLHINPSDFAIGASSFLVSFLYNLMGTGRVRKIIENYAAMYRQLTQDPQKMKELEVLTYFANTYRKDLVNKCKIAVNMGISLSDIKAPNEQSQFFELCQGWGNFVIDNIHQTPGLFDVDYAFNHYVMLVERKLKWSRVDQKKNKREVSVDPSVISITNTDISSPDPKQILLVLFIDALKKSSNNSHMNLNEYPLNFSLMKAFYKNSYDVLFEDLLTTGTLERYKVSVNASGASYLDKLFSITEDETVNEFVRMRNQQFVNVVDNFVQTSSTSMYRYYLAGWNEPLLNPKDYYPTLKTE